MTEKELLMYAMDNGMIDITTIQQEFEMNERKKYLEMHENDIWQGSNGYYYTYIQKTNKERRLIKRKYLKDLEDVVIKNKKGTDDKEPSVEKAFKGWIAEKERFNEVEKQTINRYSSDFKKYFKTFGKRKIRYIDEKDLETFIKTTIADNNLSNKQWGNVRILINGIWKYAKKNEMTNLSISNFMGDLQLSRKAFKKKIINDDEQVFMDDEVEMIISHIKRNPDELGVGVLIAIQSGLRAGEISALEYTDLEGYLLSVTKTEVRWKDDEGHYHYDVRHSTKGERGSRKIVVTDDCLRTFEMAKALCPDSKYLLEKDGHRIKGHDFSMKLYRLCDKLGIKRRSMHKCRKTYATKLLNAGVSEKLVQNQMGHTDINTTRSYYWFRNTNSEEDKQAIENVFKNA